MKISFHGASQEVTGSCILIELSNCRFLVDCGMFQGEQSYGKNFAPFEFDPKQIDFVLLTHAHVDHCGRLPRLVKAGFKGKIFCTPPTTELAILMMLDSAKIFLSEQGKGHEPLYYDYDIAETKSLFSEIFYDKEKTIMSGVKVTARDAGHILGSAIFEVTVNDAGVVKKIVFSGDLGNSPSVILKDTEIISGADVVFMDSTYGNEVHEPRSQGREKLKDAIKEIIEEKNTLIVPIFALERIQEILYDLNVMVEREEIPYVPIFLDSPLAIKTMEVYRKYAKDYFNNSAVARMNAGDDIFSFNGLKFTPGIKQSLSIEKVRPPKVILSGGGMISGGRIRGYIEEYVESSRNHILLVSYQAEGTIGRQLLDGAKEIKIGKNKVSVRAKISSILSFSSHADEPRLLNWIKNINKTKPNQIFLLHGEDESASPLAITIKKELGIKTIVSEPKKVYEI